MAHDCKACHRQGECEAEDEVTQARKHLEEGGVSKLASWTQEAFLVSPDETFNRVQLSLMVIEDQVGLMQEYRSRVMGGAEKPQVIEDALRRMFQAVSDEITKEIMEGALMQSLSITQALGTTLGKRLQVRLPEDHPATMH